MKISGIAFFIFSFLYFSVLFFNLSNYVFIFLIFVDQSTTFLTLKSLNCSNCFSLLSLSITSANGQSNRSRDIMNWLCMAKTRASTCYKQKNKYDNEKFFFVVAKPRRGIPSPIEDSHLQESRRLNMLDANAVHVARQFVCDELRAGIVF